MVKSWHGSNIQLHILSRLAAVKQFFIGFPKFPNELEKCVFSNIAIEIWENAIIIYSTVLGDTWSNKRSINQQLINTLFSEKVRD